MRRLVLLILVCLLASCTEVRIAQPFGELRELKQEEVKEMTGFWMSCDCIIEVRVTNAAKAEFEMRLEQNSKETVMTGCWRGAGDERMLFVKTDKEPGVMPLLPLAKEKEDETFLFAVLDAKYLDELSEAGKLKVTHVAEYRLRLDEDLKALPDLLSRNRHDQVLWLWQHPLQLRKLKENEVKELLEKRKQAAAAKASPAPPEIKPAPAKEFDAEPLSK